MADRTGGRLDVRLGVDIDPICKDTYEKNNGVPFECADVRTNLRTRITRALEKKHNRPVIFAACAPCQPFSRLTNGIPSELSVLYSNDMGVARYRIAYAYHHYAPPFLPDRVTLFFQAPEKEIEYRTYEILSLRAAAGRDVVVAPCVHRRGAEER